MNRRDFSLIFRSEIRRLMAKSRPETLFEQVFYDIREMVKKKKEELESEQKDRLESEVVKDLRSKKVPILDSKLSLGRYKGSSFVTSHKLKVRVKNQKEAEAIAEYLRGKYSPKWKVKNVSDDGVAELNVR